VAQVAVAAGEDHGEKGESETDDLEQGSKRRDDDHSVEQRRVGRQHEHG
jgi:hypothetical protein